MTKHARILLVTIFVCLMIVGVFLLIGKKWVGESVSGSGSFSLGKGIGLVKVNGVLTEPEWLAGELKKLRDNPSVPAVVLRINSPGGSVAAAQEIREEVRKYRMHDKPLVVSMGNVAASGGYYIASPGHTLFANPGTLTGSIGVIMRLPQSEELLKKLGVGEEIVKSGNYKDIGRPSRRMTRQERKILQGVVDDSYDQFLQAVTNDRVITRSQLKEVADGRVFTGRQAMRLGLVDTLGSLQDAIDFAATLAGIEGDPKIVEPKRKVPTNWRNFLFRSLFGVVDDVLSADSDHGLLRYEFQ